MSDDEATPEQLLDRLRVAAEQGKGVRLDRDATYALFRMLDRAVTLQDDVEHLDREADAAAYILTGDYPSLRKYQQPAASTDAAPGDGPADR